MKRLFVPEGKGECLTFPGAIELTFLVPGSATDGRFALFEDRVEPGMGPPRHIHENQDECFMVIEGKFLFEIEGEQNQAEVGDVALVPRKAVHAFKNIGDRAGRLRYLFSPAGTSENMFRAFHEVEQNGELTPDRMAKIAVGYGQKFVGPPL